MATNINLRITAKTQLGSTLAQLRAMEQGMAGVQRRADSFADNLNATGQFSHDGWRLIKEDMQDVRHHYREVIDASGQYYGATKNITSETTRFNEALSRQKMSLREIVTNFGTARAAMKEQMALNQMMVKSWSRDATGKMSVDMWVPKAEDIDLSGFKHMRQQVQYMNQLLNIGSKEMINWGKNIQWAGRQLTVGFSVPISIAGGFMARFALEADESLVRIAKVYGDTTSAFQASNESIRAMATETALHVAKQYGLAAEDTRQVMAELAATGLEGAELQNMTVATQRLSLLGEMNPEQSLKLMRTMKEVYGFSSAELDKQVDYFNAIENATALTMQDITDGIPRIAGMMEATGTSIKDQTALLVAFKAAGIDVAEGANALKSINFKAIAASPTARNSFLRITGQDMTELIEKHNAEFLPMMNEIADIIQTLDQPDKMDLISRVFGIHQGNRAITLLNQLTTGSEAMARANEVGMMDSVELAALANREIGTIQESLSTRFKRIVETIKANMAAMGEPILEVILPIGEAIANLMDKFNNLSDSAKKNFAKVALALAVFGPLVMLTGLMGNLVGMFLRGVSAIIGLAGTFKILNAESHAASLIQKAAAASASQHTQALIAQTTAANNLTQALRLNSQAAATNAAIPSMGVGGIGDLSGISGVKTRVTGPSSNISQIKHLEQTRRSWEKVGHAINGASVAMMGLGAVTGNETLTKVSAVAMTLGTLGPIAGGASKTVANAFMKTGNSTSRLVAKVRGLSGGVAALGKGLLATLTGPVGLAVTAAAGIAFAAWAKHRKQVQELKKDYENLTNSADVLGKVYGFTPTTQLQRDLEEDPIGAPRTTLAQNERIKLYKAEEEYGQTIIRQRERIADLSDEQAQKDAALAEAAAQARQVLLSGGTEEQARLAAWDWYTMLSEEWITFDAFTAKVNVEWEGGDIAAGMLKGFKDAEAELNKVMEQALATQAKRSRRSHRAALFTNEDAAKMKQSYTRALESALSIEDTEQRFDALEGVFGDKVRRLQEIFREGMDMGWLKEEDRNIQSFLENIADAVELRDLTPGLGAYNPAEIQRLQIMADVLLENNNAMADLIGKEDDVMGVLSGRKMLIDDFVNQKRMENLMDKEAMYLANDRQELAAEMKRQQEEELQRAEEMYNIEQERLRVEKEKAYWKGVNPETSSSMFVQHPEGFNFEREIPPMIRAAEKVEGAGDAVGDGADKLDDAAQALEDAKFQRYADSFREAQSQAMNDLADYYQTQFDKGQAAERKAFDEKHDALMQEIEDEYETNLELLEADQKGRRKSMEARHKAQQKALKVEREAAEEALNKANKAANKRLDARTKAAREAEKKESKALSERYKELDKQLQESQEKRRDDIERTFDLQVEKIEAQIAEEERLEEIRQRMFDAEKERISRLREMFSSNIDLNMAINSGDLDEAARIASEMSAKQGEWALDDLSQISSDASETRKERMEAEIDRIEERKEARLEALKEIEEAEKEALQRREEAEELALEKKYQRIEDEISAEKEKLAELHELNRKALADDYNLREESLSERQAQAKEAQDEIFSDEKKRLEETRDTDKAIQAEATENARAENEERLDNAKKSFDRELDSWRGMLATSGAEFNTHHQDMYSALKTRYMPNIEKANVTHVKQIWDDAKKTQDNRLRQLESDAAFTEFAKKLTKEMVKGIYGGDMSLAEFRKFIRTGELPAEKPTRGVNDYSRTRRVMRHSGGVIGEGAAYSKYNSRTGPGFSKAKEVPMVGLEGEGVLNLRAMKTPGVPQLMDALNRGTDPHSMVAQFAAPGDKRAGGATGLGQAGLMAAAPLIMRRVSETAILTGLEVGLAKAEAKYNPVNIKLAQEQRQGLSDEQISNASAIVTTGRRMGASQRDILTALMTAMQESSLRNLGYGDDIYGVRNPDGSLTSSLGLFQQQKWWGTRSERLDPYKSSELFYKALFQVGNRDEMPLTLAAQEVQRSAYPNAYAKWEGLARVLLNSASADVGQIVNPGDPNKKRIEELRKRLESARESQNGFMFPTTGMISWLYGWRHMFANPDMHNGLDIRAPGGTPVYASAAGRVKTGWDSYGGGNYVQLDHGNGLFTNYLHLSRKIAKDGQMVRRGERIGDVGNTGKLSRGNHLHFMVGRGGPWNHVDPNPYMPRRVKVGDYVSPQTGAGMWNGGWVTGTGNTDNQPRMLTPKEFVVKKRVATRHGDFLEALNNEQIDLMPLSGSLAPSVPGAGAGSIDSSATVMYNIDIKTGPVNSDVDIQRAVEKAVKGIERKKSHSRRIK